MDKSGLIRTCDGVIEAGILVSLLLQPIPHYTATIKAFALYLPLAAWVAKMALQRRFGVEKSAVNLPFLIVVGISLISLLLSPLLVENLREVRGSLVKFVVIFFLVTANIRRPEQLRRMTFALAGLYGLTLLGGYYNFLFADKFALNGGYRDLWVFNNGNNQLGTLLNVTFPFAFVVLLRYSGRGKSLLLAALCLVHAFSFALTFSRGAWFGFVTAGLVLAFLEKRTLIAFGVIGALVVGVVTLAGTGRFTRASMEKSLTIRWEQIWVPALHMVESRPWLGHGYGWRTAQRIYPEYRRPGNLPTYLNEHDTLLAVTVQTGLLGLFFYLIMLWFVAREIYLAWRRSSGTCHAIAGAVLFVFVAEYLVHGLDEVNNMDWMGFFFWALTGMAVVIRRISPLAATAGSVLRPGPAAERAAGFVSPGEARG